MDQQPSVSVETLAAIAEAFNAHDLDAIMEFFADECSLDMPRGPEPWGQRFVGKRPSVRGWRAVSRACPTCTTAMIGTGGVATLVFGMVAYGNHT